MRQVYIAGNWKMNNTVASSVVLINDICARIPQSPKHICVIVAPPFTALASVQAQIASAPITLAAQNISCAEAGAHTGEISAAMLKELGVEYAIIGHSERRHVYGEDDALVAKRVERACANGITPIVCVGETLAEREKGEHFAVCERQLVAALQHIETERIADIVIAYEPVWAIGTGKVASVQDASEMHAHLRRILVKISNQEIGTGVSILYGGSVKPDNSKALLEQEDIDGALIGGASLKAESFVAIMESAL